MPHRVNRLTNDRIARFIKVFWIAGLALELLFIGHYEDWLQYLPLIIMGVSLLIYFSTKNKKILKGISLLTILVGILGIGVHLKNNFEFELEMYPELSGWLLLKQSMTGALPVMAPGSLISVGLLGFLITRLTN